MDTRARREQAYWDGAYAPAGPEHHKYLWTKQVEGISYIAEYFRGLLAGVRGARILSLGGGVDRLGVQLAAAGNRVVTVDVAATAATPTARIADEAGVGDSVTTLVGTGEDVPLASASFDVVLCKRALHHMDIPRVLRRAHELLAPGGRFLAEEPICLLGVFRWLHRKVPFHPEAPRTADERELTDEDFALIRALFPRVKVSYFDFLTRESVAYFLFKAGVARLLNPLGKMDWLLLNRLTPLLRYLGSYAVIDAVKEGDARGPS